MCTYVRTCMYVCMYPCMHACMSVCMYACMHVYLYIHIHIDTYKHIHALAQTIDMIVVTIQSVVFNSPPEISVSHIVITRSSLGECMYTYRPQIPGGLQVTITVAPAGGTPWYWPHFVNGGLLNWSMVTVHLWFLTNTVKSFWMWMQQKNR